MERTWTDAFRIWIRAQVFTLGLPEGQSGCPGLSGCLASTEGGSCCCSCTSDPPEAARVLSVCCSRSLGWPVVTRWCHHGSVPLSLLCHLSPEGQAMLRLTVLRASKGCCRLWAQGHRTVLSRREAVPTRTSPSARTAYPEPFSRAPAAHCAEERPADCSVTFHICKRGDDQTELGQRGGEAAAGSQSCLPQWPRAPASPVCHQLGRGGRPRPGRGACHAAWVRSSTVWLDSTASRGAGGAEDMLGCLGPLGIQPGPRPSPCLQPRGGEGLK